MIFNQLLYDKFNEGFTKMKPSAVVSRRSDLINNAVQSL